jgi:sporulation protein YlmC with PRC-barrel domain
MELKQNASVLTADAREVGHLGRVVVNPQTKEITHLVVRKGLLFTEDHVVPIDYVDWATEDQITLRHAAGDLRTLPPFEEQHGTLVDEGLARPNMIPPADQAPVLAGMSEGYRPPPGQRLMAHIEQNIPDGTVALKEGAKVITADGKHAGTVEYIATGPDTLQITHLQITKGLLTKEKRPIPIAWVSLLGEDEVHLSVDQKTLEAVSPHPN